MSTNLSWAWLNKRIKKLVLQQAEGNKFINIEGKAGKEFEKIGRIITEGQNRGFTKQEVIQLIIGKVIRL